MHVGWIGLGRVGMQMALVTLAAGHEVTGHSRSFDRHAEVEAAGGKLCASATETVRDADIVCANVHLGPTGAGMTLKIVNNLLYAAHVSLGREAIGLAVQNGISVHDALAALRRGSADSFALGVYQEGDDPDRVFDTSRPYLEKDVAIGLDAFPGLVDIRGATTRFTA